MTKTMRWVAICSAALGLALVGAGCDSGPTSQGTLSEPPDNGGITIDDAVRTSASGWIKGFIVARKGEPVRLCSTLQPGQPPSVEPSCGGASLVLKDRILWRLPNNPTIFASVLNGVLTQSFDDPENPSDAQPCTYGPSLGPCAGFPYLHATDTTIWSDHEYSVIGTVQDGTLVELRETRP